MATNDDTLSLLETMARAHDERLREELAENPGWLTRSAQLLLTANSDAERIAAAQEIGEMGRHGATPEVLAALVTAFHQTTPDSALLEPLINTLAALGREAAVFPEVLRAVRGSLTGAPTPVREEACWHLGLLDFQGAPDEDRAAMTALLTALSQDTALSAEARQWAQEALPKAPFVPIGERVRGVLDAIQRSLSSQGAVHASAAVGRPQGEKQEGDVLRVPGQDELTYQRFEHPPTERVFAELTGSGIDWRGTAVVVTFDDGTRGLVVLGEERLRGQFSGLLPLTSVERTITEAEELAAEDLEYEEAKALVLPALQALHGWDPSGLNRLRAWLQNAPETVLPAFVDDTTP